MADNDDELEGSGTGDIVGNPQTGTAAGESATSGNSTGGDSSSVDSDNDPGDDLEGSGSDETEADELEGGADDDDSPDDDDLPGGELARARRQAARYRTELRDSQTRAGELEAALWRARLELDGRLADPDDLPVDPELVDDPDGIRAAVDALLERKPHLRSRRIRERAGQGEGSASASVSLAELLSRGA